MIGMITEKIGYKYFGSYSIMPKSYKYFNDKYQKIKKIFETQFKAVMNFNLNKYYLKTIFNDEIFTVIRFDKNKKSEDIISFDFNNKLYFVGNNHDKGKIIGNGKCLKYINCICINFLKSGYINKNKFSFKNKVFIPNKDNIIKPFILIPQSCFQLIFENFLFFFSL